MGYRERLAPPWWWWPLLLGGLAGLATEVYGGWGLATGLVTTAVLVGAGAALLIGVSRTRISVTGSGLQVGKTRLPAANVSVVKPLDRAATRHRLGAGADPAARLLVRGWIPTAVEVGVHGEHAPYWLISTRHPDRLAAAIDRARLLQNGGERSAEVTAAGNGDAG